MTSRGKALTLAVACLGAALGCGARTETLFDDGTGGSSFGAFAGDGLGAFAGGGFGGQAMGGSHATGGSLGLAGSAPVGGFGTGGFGTAGGIGVGGSFGGGAGGSLGAAGFAGTGFPFGGTFGAGGSVSAGGSLGTAGTVSTGGFGAVAGSSEAGAGGSGGIVELCVGASQSACNKCVCQSCGTQLNSCFSDIGCALIFACVAQTQCQGIACYQNSTCRPVIDQFGGLAGPALSEVFSVATCSVTSRGSCGCN
jgi:hypothetical protein